MFELSNLRSFSLLQLLHENAQIGIAGRRLNMNFYKVEEFHLQAISNFLTCENKESNFSSHALACVGSSSSPVSEPGILVLFPNTSISGEYPCRIPHVFFAVGHCANACCNCE